MSDQELPGGSQALMRRMDILFDEPKRHAPALRKAKGAPCPAGRACSARAGIEHFLQYSVKELEIFEFVQEGFSNDLNSISSSLKTFRSTLADSFDESEVDTTKQRNIDDVRAAMLEFQDFQHPERENEDDRGQNPQDPSQRVDKAALELLHCYDEYAREKVTVASLIKRFNVEDNEFAARKLETAKMFSGILQGPCLEGEEEEQSLPPTPSASSDDEVDFSPKQQSRPSLRVALLKHAVSLTRKVRRSWHGGEVPAYVH